MFATVSERTLTRPVPSVRPLGTILRTPFETVPQQAMRQGGNPQTPLAGLRRYSVVMFAMPLGVVPKPCSNKLRMVNDLPERWRLLPKWHDLLLPLTQSWVFFVCQFGHVLTKSKLDLLNHTNDAFLSCFLQEGISTRQNWCRWTSREKKVGTMWVT